MTFNLPTEQIAKLVAEKLPDYSAPEFVRRDGTYGFKYTFDMYGPIIRFKNWKGNRETYRDGSDD